MILKINTESNEHKNIRFENALYVFDLRLNLASVARIIDKENIVINKFKAVMKNNKIIKRFNLSKNLSKK